MSWVGFLVGVLAVWRVTHLLHVEDGPWSAFARLRAAASVGFWGGLLGCFYCLSLWTSVPVAWWLARGPWDGVVVWLGLSGGAILLERATGADGPAVPIWVEHDGVEGGESVGGREVQDGRSHDLPPEPGRSAGHGPPFLEVDRGVLRR